ncbi:hypothetical protein [Kutzneria albida]|uniref:Putative secreted protein n=1 Tax=Kutzneria albida DSM 43870 TaxID=1449976 RepID=W5WFS4_9PSEU|nr:hypothetical protein [Kutzneria albida]AHH97024.1 putative secreted protein [Kutzneria albida DSM 43870]
MRASRRAALRLLAAGGLATALPVAATAEAAAPADLVMVIRHGEKAAHSGPPFGVTADGRQDGSSLNPRGWSRAGALVGLFTGAGAGLRAPTAIYAAAPTADGKRHRMAQTVSPLAARLGLRVNTTYTKGDEVELVAEVARLTGSTLICWEHGEIPLIGQLLGPVSPAPPTRWSGDRFDQIWLFTRTGTGWGFTQRAQALLDGDLPRT